MIMKHKAPTVQAIRVYGKLNKALLPARNPQTPTCPRLPD